MQFVNNEPAVSPVDDDSSGDDTRSPGVPGVSPPPGPAAPPQAGNATQPPEYISSIVVVEPAPGFSMTGRDFDTLVGAVKPKKEKGKVSFFELFRFATALDLTVTVLGACASAGAGVLMPIFTLLMGSMIDSFGTGSSSSTVESSESQVANSGGIDTSSLNKNAKYMVYIGAAGFVLQFISALCLNTSARNQAMRIRKLFYRATLRQEMGWFDSQKVGGLTVYLSDVTTIQKGIGEKIGMFAEVFSTLIAGWVIGFVKGWKMSLLILAAVPLIVITFGLMNVAFQKYVNKAQLFYNKAGQIAQEILGSIRTVTSLGIQKQSLTRYNEALEVTRDMGYRKGISTGLSFGMMMLILQGIFGLAFWYGSTLIDGPAKWVNGVFHRDSEMSTGDVIIVFFSILQGAMGLAMLSPTVNAVMEASGAAYPVFKIIDRESKIDPSIEEGRRPEIRDISFQNITFHYPTRPQANVLNGFTLNIKKGQTVALVGPSGCGKSTLVGLLQRFYDVEEGCGEVLLDGESIKTINIAHLRSQIGIVSQEPVLFATTIGQNIMYGTNKPVTMDDVIRVSKMANAHDFISKLPQGYETVVGERGVMLSGGQKQRIAIARTLIREPQIMLFDEATSALDTESEGVVQEAIDKISKGRTSIIIAHRLSTVRHADLIVAVNGGKVSEMGTHDELMARKGLYFGLVEKQRLQGKNETKKLKRSALKESIRANEAEQKKEKESESNNATLSQIIQRAYSLMAPNAIWVSWAIVGAIVNGAVQPCQSLLMSSMMQTLMKIAYVPDNSSYKSEIKYYSLGFLGIGFAALIANILQNSCIEVAGSRLTTMLRQESFKAMLRQEIGWFDDDEHPTGVLSTRLASDSSAVHSLTGSQMCLIVQMFSSVATGLAIAFAGSWKLALVVMCAVPFIIISSYMHIQSLTGTDEGTRKMYEKSGQVATESLENIRTVAALGKETMFIGQVDYLLNTTKVASYKSYFVNAIGRGIQAISQNWMTALAFWYGGKLAKSDGLSITGLFRALFGIMFGTMTIGQSSSNLADIGKALTSCNHIFELIDRKPHIPPVEGLEISNKRLLPPKKNWPVHIEDPKIEKKLQSLRLSTNADMEISTSPQPGIVEAPMAIKDLHGHIEFREIQFEYPSRPGARILRGLNLVIRPRQTVALVGPSGCGKSTVIGLLERFYDPLSGEVFVDGRPLNTLSLSWIRSQIGHVGQEPTLFAMTIRENILYGKPEASMEEVVAAAKSANAHNFIMTFPLKYETMIGERGVSLSGGQKQRIAIARALLRNPRILLLDEATSALDADSERIVQEALDRAREGRTTIVIAHRLSTVVNADQIVVINRGKVAEAGTHNELLALGGLYSRLAAAQM